MPTYFDASQLIDLGSAPNANDGDTLRTAGSKINTALQDIDSALDALDSDFRVAFDSSQIGTDAISTAKIQDGAVTAAKLTPGSLSNTVYAGQTDDAMAYLTGGCNRCLDFAEPHVVSI